MADNLFAGRRGPAAPNSARPFAECYVAFLDILGYRAIIEAHKERGSACDQIARFERMLDEALRAYARRDGDAHWISARAFSDNICLAGRTGGRGTVWTFLAAVSHVTYRLALDGQRPAPRRVRVVMGNVALCLDDIALDRRPVLPPPLPIRDDP